ncbi:L-histidine N(alpha)-methyltransferase [Nitrospirillum sp. BR 11828]|uniref:L-histidine N(alpha)-methyltransferase n=1 Tax=Nitrospirillum sp. BR 11828 TaxID=3104325 RepID=UPI002ACA28C8|nr:L-histidine N(alpha)-methyltransferase [Nitrospirillum sp. BR 11828]MDZ5648657.1 L-histidine N(alpha)-methyltransferase [Nitrospirillum sp. BR 11828]
MIVTDVIDRVSFMDFEPAAASFRDDVLAGLSHPIRRIPCKYLYDATGAALFERICELPEYYPTRTELGMLRQSGDEIAALAGPEAQVVEFGTGDGRKSRLLLSALDRPASYVSIDISRDQLIREAAALALDMPQVEITAVCGDYTQQTLSLPAIGRRRIGFFPGSTIGNLTPVAATAFLARCAHLLPGGAMLVGVDIPKDVSVVEAAYNDSAGVTAAFSLNLLARINRELGGTFDLSGFRHYAYFNEAQSKIEIFLISQREQRAAVAGRFFHFRAGERIHIEDSYKLAPATFQNMARAAGFEPTKVWVDPDGLFSLHWLLAPL